MGSKTVEIIIGILAAAGSFATFIKLFADWKGSPTDYISVIGAIILIVITAWFLLHGEVSKLFAKWSLSNQIAKAVIDANLAKEDQQELMDILQKGKDKRVLPVLLDLLSQIIDQTVSSTIRIGAPIQFETTRPPLIKSLAKLLLIFLQRDDLTEKVINDKIEILGSGSVTLQEAQSIILDLPVLQWSKVEEERKSGYREEFINQMVNAQLLTKDAFRLGNLDYSIRFNVNEFFFSNVTIKLKLDMLFEARKRFEQANINTIVLIHRESVHGRMNAMIQDLATSLAASFLIFTKESPSDGLFRKEVFDQCSKGQKTLLVEPLLIGDNLLDEAYEFLKNNGVTVVAVYIIFQERNFDINGLKYAGEIRVLCGENGPTGQVILDLKPARRT